MKIKTAGILYVVAAYVSWGLLPIYWKMLNQVPAAQIIAHRIFWSFVFVILLLWRQNRWAEFKKTFSLGKSRRLCILTAFILGFNWFTYIWAVNADRILDASLGYFINPLLSVLLGVIFLKERLNFWQKVALILAFIGVIYRTLQYGKIPWVALTLAFTFGVYGLLRKKAHIKSLVGLSAEMILLSPIVLTFLVMAEIKGTGVTGHAAFSIHLLLLGTGIVTAAPLLWFTYGVRKIPLSTAGFLQYIAPSFQLFLGVVVYKELFTSSHLISFSFIWVALILYSLSNTRLMRRLKMESRG